MSKLRQIQALVQNGLYYLTEHADSEAAADGFTGKVRVITVYEDRPKRR